MKEKCPLADKYHFVTAIEHRLRKEEMEEKFNKEAKEGWRFAAGAARITDERAGSEDQKRTSGGVLVAVDSNLGAVVGEKEGAVKCISGNEGGIAKVWENWTWTCANVCSILLARGGMDPKK